jgi:hypothetical protein
LGVEVPVQLIFVMGNDYPQGLLAIPSSALKSYQLYKQEEQNSFVMKKDLYFYLI